MHSTAMKKARFQPRRVVPEEEKRDDLRAHLAELYARLISVPAPPDLLINRFFRLRHNQLPPPARGFLGATVYALLRRRVRTILLARAAGVVRTDDIREAMSQLTPPEEAALALFRWAREDTGLSAPDAFRQTREAIQRFLKRPTATGDEPFTNWGRPEAVLTAFMEVYDAVPLPENLRRAATVSMAPDILDRWIAQMGEDRAVALAKALGETAPLDLRVNTLKATREECRERLAREGFDSDPTPHSPDCLRVARKGAIFRVGAFEDGWFELQDEASQLVSVALDPHPNWRVLDACAGGGGKTLHLAALMKGKGEILAHDIEAERLEPLGKRLKRAGAQNVRLIGPGEAPQRGPFDAVLIDAPCLGLGTLRRNPDMAWRAPIGQRLMEITAMQEQCIRDYAPLVKPGGVLVYATCSFEPEETEEMGARILALGFEPDPFPKRTPETLRDAGSVITLLPTTHGTDGFHIRRYRKTK